MDDVWIVTNWQAIQWVRNPTPLPLLHTFEPFGCNYPVRRYIYSSSSIEKWRRFVLFILEFSIDRIGRRSATIRRCAICGTRAGWGTWKLVKRVRTSIRGRARPGYEAVASTTTSMRTNEGKGGRGKRDRCSVRSRSTQPEWSVAAPTEEEIVIFVTAIRFKSRPLFLSSLQPNETYIQLEYANEIERNSKERKEGRNEGRRNEERKEGTKEGPTTPSQHCSPSFP